MTFIFFALAYLARQILLLKPFSAHQPSGAELLLALKRSGYTPDPRWKSRRVQ